MANSTVETEGSHNDVPLRTHYLLLEIQMIFYSCDISNYCKRHCYGYLLWMTFISCCIIYKMKLTGFYWSVE